MEYRIREFGSEERLGGRLRSSLLRFYDNGMFLTPKDTRKAGTSSCWRDSGLHWTTLGSKFFEWWRERRPTAKTVSKPALPVTLDNKRRSHLTQSLPDNPTDNEFSPLFPGTGQRVTVCSKTGTWRRAATTSNPVFGRRSVPKGNELMPGSA